MQTTLREGVIYLYLHLGRQREQRGMAVYATNVFKLLCIKMIVVVGYQQPRVGTPPSAICKRARKILVCSTRAYIPPVRSAHDLLLYRG